MKKLQRINDEVYIVMNDIIYNINKVIISFDKPFLSTDLIDVTLCRKNLIHTAKPNIFEKALSELQGIYTTNNTDLFLPLIQSPTISTTEVTFTITGLVFNQLKKVGFHLGSYIDEYAY